MKKIIALLLAGVLALGLLAGCDTSGQDATTPKTNSPSGGNDTQPVSLADAKIGIILIGDENEGYSYAHIEGIRKAMETLGLTDDNVIFKYTIPEDEKCYDTAVDLADQGCQLIISNSYSHQSYMVQAAEEYPNITFVADTGDTAAVCGLPNVKNAFPHTYESRYVSGVVAGMKLKELLDAGTVKDPYIGYVGAYPYAEVVSGYTAFFLGIRSIVPEAHMDVVYTNAWFDMNAEAEAANALMARGCVIIGQHADSTGAPSAVEAALGKGTVAYSVGYNVDMLSVAPNAALTSSQNNWAAFYLYAFSCLLEGKEIMTDWSAGYAEDAVMISTLGQSCAAGTAEKVAEVEAAIKNGSLKVFDASTFTVDGQKLDAHEFDFSIIDFSTGNVIYAGEKVNVLTDGYFHESEHRSAPYFDLRIDGITELTEES